MVWFRVDDNLAFHQKAIIAGNEAMGMWVRAGAQSAHLLSDGFISTEVVEALGGKRLAKRLVTARLWLEVEGGYQFHDWIVRNPTRVAVEEERKAAAARKERWKERRRNASGDGDGTRDETPTERVPERVRNASPRLTKASSLPEKWSQDDNGVPLDASESWSQDDNNAPESPSGNPPTQGRYSRGNTANSPSSERVPNASRNAAPTRAATRPDPTHTQLEKTGPAKRGTRLPDDWTPDPELIEQMRGEGITDDLARRELPKFRDHWAAAAGQTATKLDWRAAWRNWLRRSNEPPPGRAAVNGQRTYNEPVGPSGVPEW